MKRDHLLFWILAAFLLSCCFYNTCRAQTVVTFSILPPGKDGQVQGVGRARYYLLEDYLRLAQFDSELFSARNQLELWGRVGAGLKQELEAKDAVIKTLEDDKKILGDRSLRLEDKWKTCEKELQDASSGPIWPYFLAAGGAVLGIVGAVLIGVSQHGK